MRWFLLLAALVGCASAHHDSPLGQQPDAALPPGPDAGGGRDAAPMADAPSADAPPADAPGTQTRTLSQTNSQTLTAGTSIACGNAQGTSANSFYRVFDLGALGITSDFHVTTVSFQIEDSEGGNVVAARVGTYGGTPGATLTSSMITILASNATVSVPNVVETFDANNNASTPGGMVDAPVAATIPAGQKLLIEVDVPDGTAGSGGKFFYMGANAGGETGDSYFSATACTPPGATPTDVSQVAMSNVDLLFTVTGTY